MLMISKLAKCPFYIDEDKNIIRCEGLVSTQAIQRFDHCVDKDKHKRKHCNENYENCLFFQSVEKKY